MKLGTENKNKTIFAAVLLGIALLFLARWVFMSSGGSSEQPRRSVTAAPISATASDQPQASAKSRREDRKEEKTLRAAWKPTLDPRLNLSMLKGSEDIVYEGKGRNIFEDTPEPEIKIPTPVASGRMDGGKLAASGSVPLQPISPPPPPPFDLKFFGFANKQGGQRSIFLAQGDSVFVAREGDIVARRYKIVHINQSSVEVQDVLSNRTQTLALTAG
jgi:hypothetical protein